MTNLTREQIESYKQFNCVCTINPQYKCMCCIICDMALRAAESGAVAWKTIETAPRDEAEWLERVRADSRIYRETAELLREAAAMLKGQS